ncbi:MAG TPA: hypothetical protein ENK40_03640, partial [Gammaproteobacteria bacterium]|nr:hypothetical protein [Gammaproteobacteria bacterium]
MIRFFVLTGLAGGAVVAWLTTAGVGPVSQLPPPESLLTRFREEGFVPQEVNLPVDETAEEMEVFEVPPEDEDRLAEAEAAFEEMMGGMDMGGMDMSNTMNMAEGGADAAPMDMNAADGGTMNMAEGGADAAPMDMNAADSGTMNMAEGGADAAPM